MKLIPFYETAETNGIITHKKTIFKPKGKCKFYSTLEYKWRNIHLYVEMDTDHKVTNAQYAKWVQANLNIFEREFYGKLVMTKLKLGIVNSVEPVTGCYKAYVVI